MVPVFPGLQVLKTNPLFHCCGQKLLPSSQSFFHLSEMKPHHEEKFLTTC